MNLPFTERLTPKIAPKTPFSSSDPNTRALVYTSDDTVLIRIFERSHATFGLEYVAWSQCNPGYDPAEHTWMIFDPPNATIFETIEHAIREAKAYAHAVGLSSKSIKIQNLIPKPNT